MRSYTVQIGEGSDDAMSKPTYSEELHADSLGEAIDKAEAIVRLRPVHARETTVRLIDRSAADYPLWASTVEAIRGS